MGFGSVLAQFWYRLFQSYDLTPEARFSGWHASVDGRGTGTPCRWCGLTMWNVKQGCPKNPYDADGRKR